MNSSCYEYQRNIHKNTLTIYITKNAYNFESYDTKMRTNKCSDCDRNPSWSLLPVLIGDCVEYI
jgi:hypothetical protein